MNLYSSSKSYISLTAFYALSLCDYKMNFHSHPSCEIMYVTKGCCQIFIDNENGISLNDCDKVNDAITDMLDSANYIKDQYFLEISSPGIERNIRTDKHLQLNLNEEINVKLFKAIEKKKELEGILKKFDDETITLENENNDDIIIQRNNISSMKRAFKWN